jgi:ferrochelatase
VDFAPAWPEHPRFIEAAAARVAEALDGVPAERRSVVPVVFTAHSVPVAMADGSPYVAQVTGASRLVAERLGLARWSVAYQSRSGSPRDPWLAPDVADALSELARDGVRDVVVSPIGFVVDHVEVLYDLDVEARRVAEDAGLRLHRAAALNDHPAFIDLLADLVLRAARVGSAPGRR